MLLFMYISHMEQWSMKMARQILHRPDGAEINWKPWTMWYEWNKFSKKIERTDCGSAIQILYIFASFVGKKNNN